MSLNSEVVILTLLYCFPHIPPHSASRQRSLGQFIGRSQVWDESGHQSQAQRDLHTGGVQQHQPGGVTVGVGQSQPTPHFSA